MSKNRVLIGAEESVLPCWATLLEDPASAGEELLERVLKGDCLKRSSRKGLENHKLPLDSINVIRYILAA